MNQTVQHMHACYKSNFAALDSIRNHSLVSYLMSGSACFMCQSLLFVAVVNVYFIAGRAQMFPATSGCQTGELREEGGRVSHQRDGCCEGGVGKTNQ